VPDWVTTDWVVLRPQSDIPKATMRSPTPALTVTSLYCVGEVPVPGVSQEATSVYVSGTVVS
jgi:hypothetical protein